MKLGVIFPQTEIGSDPIAVRTAPVEVTLLCTPLLLLLLVEVTGVGGGRIGLPHCCYTWNVFAPGQNVNR